MKTVYIVEYDAPGIPYVCSCGYRNCSSREQVRSLFESEYHGRCEIRRIVKVRV